MFLIFFKKNKDLKRHFFMHFILEWAKNVSIWNSSWQPPKRGFVLRSCVHAEEVLATNLCGDFLSQFVRDLRCTVIVVSRINFFRTRYSFSAKIKIKWSAIFILVFCSSNSHLPATAVDVCRARKTNVVAFFCHRRNVAICWTYSFAVNGNRLPHQVIILIVVLFWVVSCVKLWTSNCWIVFQLVHFLVQLSRCCCSCVNRLEFAELCCSVCNAK
jgi:hypothetical protein